MHIHIEPLSVELSDPTDEDAVRVATQLLDAVRTPTDSERVMTEVSSKSSGLLIDRWERAGGHETLTEAAIQAGAVLVSGDAALPRVTLDEDVELTLTVKPFAGSPETFHA